MKIKPNKRRSQDNYKLPLNYNNNNLAVIRILFPDIITDRDFV